MFFSEEGTSMSSEDDLKHSSKYLALIQEVCVRKHIDKLKLDGIDVGLEQREKVMHIV